MKQLKRTIGLGLTALALSGISIITASAPAKADTVDPSASVVVVQLNRNAHPGPNVRQHAPQIVDGWGL